MERVNKTTQSIALGTLALMMLVPTHRTLIACIGALITAFINYMQNKLNEKYPYDIAEYIYWESERKMDRAAEVLTDFADQCPYKSGACLNSRFCPDCPHGQNR